MAKITRTGEYLTVAETAKHVGVGIRRVRALIHSGRLPVVEFGRFDVVHFDDAEQWRKQRRERPDGGFDNRPIVITGSEGEDAVI